MPREIRLDGPRTEARMFKTKKPRMRWHGGLGVKRRGVRPPRWLRGLNLGAALPLILVFGALGVWSHDFDAPIRAAGITGVASVIDGDTIEIHGRRIRLDRIDAPESGQTCFRNGTPERCGQIAANVLVAIIGGSVIECRSNGSDRYGRMLGVCYRGDLDINREMVKGGHAVAYTRYSWRYYPEELRARASGLGIWGTEFTDPETWRHSR
jgi:endonuclease YncB( thermonuclease family)